MYDQPAFTYKHPVWLRCAAVLIISGAVAGVAGLADLVWLTIASILHDSPDYTGAMIAFWVGLLVMGAGAVAMQTCHAVRAASALYGFRLYSEEFEVLHLISRRRRRFRYSDVVSARRVYLWTFPRGVRWMGYRLRFVDGRKVTVAESLACTAEMLARSHIAAEGG